MKKYITRSFVLAFFLLSSQQSFAPPPPPGDSGGTTPLGGSGGGAPVGEGLGFLLSMGMAYMASRYYASREKTVE